MINVNMIKNSISNVLSCLNSITDIQIEYEAKKKEALNDFRGLKLDEAMLSAKAEAKSAADREVAKMQFYLDSLMRETQAANDYDTTSSAVADAAKLLSATDIDRRTANTVVNKFIGNQTALNLILASAGSQEAKAAVDPWLFDNIGAVNEMKESASALTWEPPENYPTRVSNIRIGLQEYARLMGVDISSMESIISEIKMKNITIMMGLSVDQI